MATKRTSRRKANTKTAKRRTSRRSGAKPARTAAKRRTSRKAKTATKNRPRKRTMAWKEGVRIALANGQRTAPYPLESDKRYEWLDGYDRAKAEIQRVRKKLLGR